MDSKEVEAIKNFIKKYGKPKEVYVDNGKDWVHVIKK